MRFRDWATRVIFIFLMLTTLILVVVLGWSKKFQDNAKTASPDPISWNQYPQALFRADVEQEKQLNNLQSKNLQSEDNFSQTPVKVSPQLPVKTESVINKYVTTTAFTNYKPKLVAADIAPNNYGERYTRDVNGVFLQNQPIIVLHETTNSAASAINFFRNNHVDESVQASYHTLIALDGTIIYLVPPDKRAFGASNSVFKGANGVEETVKTNPDLPPSVNNFAYHVSLETPPDAWGKSNIQGHSGYTEDQYNSLAWLIAQSQVPDERITTHRDVDIANGKVDPLSFDFERFFNKLRSFRELKRVNNS